MIQNVFFICQSNTHFDSFGDINDEEMMKKTVQYFQASCGSVKCSHFPRFTGLRPECLAHNRVLIRGSQKNQKSEFCFATKPTDFHRLDEPPEKISAL